MQKTRLINKNILIVTILSCIGLAVVAMWILFIPLWPFASYFIDVDNWRLRLKGPYEEIEHVVVTSERASAEEAKRRAYLKKLTPPKLSGKEVAEILRLEKGINTEKLYDIVDWYVYRGNKDVIRQVILNRQYEEKITLPKQQGGYIKYDSTIYEGFDGPRPSWNTDIETLVAHEELHKHAARKDTDPNIIYYLLWETIPFRGQAFNMYYGQLLWYGDILAYFRIYSNYKDWPIIKEFVKSMLHEFPDTITWYDFSTVEDALAIADEQGPEKAYDFYIDRYRRNYRKWMGDLKSVKDPNISYQAESVFEGWNSEKIHAKTRVFDVDANNVEIIIEQVKEVISVKLNGTDITEACRISPKNYMIVPMVEGKVVELDYVIAVPLEWWEQFTPWNAFNRKIGEE